MTNQAVQPGYRSIIQTAWPIMLANLTVPLLGLSDVAVIGHTGSVADLGAIALGALIFNFVYWGFGFLRMSTTGFVAQASGERNEQEVRALWLRGLCLAGAIGLLLILSQKLIVNLALQLFDASVEVEQLASSYSLLRIWGAPASLAIYVCLGVLIGLGKTRELLLIQVVLNGVNIALDALFAGFLGWGSAGIALGTVIAEWVALALAVALLVRLLQQRGMNRQNWWPSSTMRNGKRWLQIMSANSDIWLRTLFMLFSFAWFTNQGARFGDVVLAANHMLLQLVSFAAFFLDGYAHVAEQLIGQALGRRQQDIFDLAVYRSSVLAGVTAVALALGLVLFGPWILGLLTEQQSVLSTAQAYLPFVAIYILLSCGAFQLDGIFIGATRTGAMRNASIIATLGFLLSAHWLTGPLDNYGLWLAFVLYVLMRAVALGWHYPALRRHVADNQRVADVG